jgi:ribosome biogenesis GTPase A
MNINWYPGHMAKTKREITERLPLIDVIYEVIDARIPFSSKIKDLDNVIKNKPRILILTKVDLCDLNETNKWIKYYENLGYKVITVDLLNIKGLNRLFELTEKVMADKNKSREQKGLLKRKYRVLIIGVPNSGKSTLINRLVGKKATNVGDRPGITRHLNWIRISDSLELLDTPGILWPKLDNENIALNLAAMSAIKEELIPIDDVSMHILKVMAKYYPDNLKKRYNIDNINFDDIEKILDMIGKKRGALVKGGEVDYDKVYSIILRDLKEGHLGKVTFDHHE